MNKPLIIGYCDNCTTKGILYPVEIKYKGKEPKVMRFCYGCRDLLRRKFNVKI